MERQRDVLKICSSQWAGSTRFRKSWKVLSDHKRPPAEGDFSWDVEGDILDFRPTSAARQLVEPRRSKDQREILWLVREKRPKLVIGSGVCRLFCSVLFHEQIRRGSWFWTISVARYRSFLFRA